MLGFKTGSFQKWLVDNIGLKVDQTTTINGQSLSGNITLDKSDIGLGNVDDTTDAGKPVSTAQLTALNGKADLDHSHATSDITGLASYVDARADAKISALTNGAGAAYDTLKELQDLILSDESTASALAITVAGKVDKISGKGLSTEDFTTPFKNILASFAANVIGTALTGFVTTSSAAVSATDSIVAAIGKLQAQLNTNIPEVLTATTNSSGDAVFTFVKTYGSNPKVFPSILAGGDSTHGVLPFISAISTTGCTVRGMKTVTTGVLLLNTNVDPDVALGSGIVINLLVYP